MSGPFKLVYFNFSGRAGAIRLAFAYGGIAFEDSRIERAQWPATKPTLPLGQVPVLYFGDGSVLTQSNAILQFVGRLAKLYPEDALAAARVEEFLGIITDFIGPIGATGSLDDATKKTIREQHLAKGAVTSLNFLEKKLKESGAFLGGSAPTIADLQLSQVVRSVQSGLFDHVPKDFFNAYPAIAAHAQLVEQLPGIADWIAAHGGQA